MIDEIERAKSHSDLDKIRNGLDYIRKARFIFNVANGESNKILASADVRFALEVFENDEHVKSTRIRIDDGTSSSYQRSKSVRNLQGIRDGLQSNRGGKLREREFAASGFRLTDNISRIKANEYYINAIEKYIEEHPNKYDKEYFSTNKNHSEQGGFSNAQIEDVRRKYQGTKEWMKAPNGKPTNLTEEQWLAVRTPNFKKWFGDWENDPENASKVVDENGEPLVVYHGSKKKFEAFDKEKQSNASFTKV